MKLKVTVPATSANLGPGFDSLGMALAHYDVYDLRLFHPVSRFRFQVRGQTQPLKMKPI